MEAIQRLVMAGRVSGVVQVRHKAEPRLTELRHTGRAGRRNDFLEEALACLKHIAWAGVQNGGGVNNCEAAGQSSVHTKQFETQTGTFGQSEFVKAEDSFCMPSQVLNVLPVFSNTVSS
jgi:hypothetical protein